MDTRHPSHTIVRPIGTARVSGPPDDILALARELAKRAAREDHEAEIAARLAAPPRDRDKAMKRAAIYARYSSDQQNEKSVDDQIAFCREICEREGFAIVRTFADREISGAFSVNRPGFLAMMRAAETKLFDIIVAEAADRLFRSPADYHAARRQLDYAGIAIHDAGGKVGKLDGALRAIVSEIFLDDLAVHTRRGLESVIRDGRHAGGRAYGYRAIVGKPGELEIVETEAEIVREIFGEYVSGRTPRAIAALLNKRGVTPARGRLWNASTINGNASRGGGILLNNLYAGQIVWNKVRMVKDPGTGKRVSRPNPKDQYRIVEAPHLRIVDEATFRAAQSRKIERRYDATPETAQKARAPKRVFSGLIKCGSCGGGMASIGADRKGWRVQCSAHRESGSCSNGRRVYLDDLELIVINGLRHHLEHPALITEYVTAYNAERKRLRREATNELAGLSDAPARSSVKLIALSMRSPRARRPSHWFSASTI